MRGRWAVAVVVALLAPALWGQMRGTARGAVMARPGFAVRGPANRGAVIVGSRATGVRFGTFRSPFFFNNRFVFNRRFRHRFLFAGVPWWYGYPGVYYSDYSYPPNMYSSYDSSAAASSEQNLQIAEEIGRLSGEIEGLRAEQDAHYAKPPQPQPEAKSELSLPTLLVFKDKHTQEVHNYAVVGQTLWIFDEQRAHKVPLSALDVESTTKANEEHGMEFRLPK